MQKVQIIHNPKCSTSREAVQILEEYGMNYDTILYLTKKLSHKRIGSILKKLGLKAMDIIRKKEPLYKDVFAGKTLSNEEWIQAMVDFPVLIERPIIIKGNKAIIGRPIENIIKFLKLKENQPK